MSLNRRMISSVSSIRFQARDYLLSNYASNRFIAIKINENDPIWLMLFEYFQLPQIGTLFLLSQRLL